MGDKPSLFIKATNTINGLPLYNKIGNRES